MIEIRIPNNNLEERKYILHIIFNEFLGLKYNINIGSNNYEFIVNNKKMIIKDTFFNKFPNNLEYLKEKNIPKKICELDIFAGSFFMLTRWEEYINKTRDKHNRFPATASLAYKEGFLNRPIVDIYVNNLKKTLLELDNSLEFKVEQNKLFLTHDVDEIYKLKGMIPLFKNIFGDIFKRKSFNLIFNRIKEYFLVKTNKINDPFDTFDLLMDISDLINVKSRFYFMCGGETVYDNRYKIDENKSLELIDKIKKRGHFIGIHPSYNAYNDSEILKKEKHLLESILGENINEGRGHYLRFEVPTTWQIWENNGMKVDSTCGYADKEGFRCGTGYEFSVFNILTRKKLNLRERPLVIMDCTLFEYNNYSIDEAENIIINLKNRSKNITFLWHNSYLKNMNFYSNICKYYYA